MARIQILDLPLLEDLTPEQMKELFGAGAKSFKPSFEALEDRMLRSVVGSVLASIQTPTVSAATFQTTAQDQSNVKQPFQVIQQPTSADMTVNQQQQNVLNIGPVPYDSSPQLGPGLQIPGGIVTGQPAPAQAIPGGVSNDLGLLAEQTTAVDKSVADAIHTDLGSEAATKSAAQGQDIFYYPVLPKLTQAQINQGVSAINLKAKFLHDTTTHGASFWQQWSGNPIQVTPDGHGLAEHFLGGSIYWSPETANYDLSRQLPASTAGAHAVTGPIHDKFAAQGWELYGYPVIDESVLKGTEGKQYADGSFHFTASFSEFYNPQLKEFRDIVRSDQFGTWEIHGNIRNEWLRVFTEVGGGIVPVARTWASGDDYDVSGVHDLARHGRAQDFQDVRPDDGRHGPGMSYTIVYNAETGTHEVHGKILQYWLDHGREWLGYPTTGVRTVAWGSDVCDFMNLDQGPDWPKTIAFAPYVRVDTPHMSFGVLQKRWAAIGGPEAGWYPTCDEFSVGGVQYQNFFNVIEGWLWQYSSDENARPNWLSTETPILSPGVPMGFASGQGQVALTNPALPGQPAGFGTLPGDLVSPAQLPAASGSPTAGLVAAAFVPADSGNPPFAEPWSLSDDALGAWLTANAGTPLTQPADPSAMELSLADPGSATSLPADAAIPAQVQSDDAAVKLDAVV